VIVARLVWRLIPGHQVAALEVGWMRIASKAVHYLLYALVTVEVALGFTVEWARGRPVSFFGLGIPGPFAAFPRPLRRELLDIHSWVAWAIIVLAGLHAAAALYHHYVLKDRVLIRMLSAGVR